MGYDIYRKSWFVTKGGWIYKNCELGEDIYVFFYNIMIRSSENFLRKGKLSKIKKEKIKEHYTEFKQCGLRRINKNVISDDEKILSNVCCFPKLTIYRCR